MVRPPLKQQPPAVDTELVSFINEYLFSPHEDAAPSTPRHQRYKRYRGLWRSAAKSLIIKKMYPPQETHLPSADQLFTKLLPPQASSQDTLLPSAVHLLRQNPAQVSLRTVGDLVSIDSQQYTHNNSIRIDVDAEEDVTPAGSTSTLRGSNNAHPLEASSTHAIPKHSSRKPPRPPRAGMSRSGSYRVNRLKTAAQRAMVANARMKKRKLPQSTSNATSVWALIVTICFASIMLVQGFFGNNSKDLDSKVDGQTLSESVSSLPPNRGMPLPSTESTTQNLVAEHGTSVDRLKSSEVRDSPFVSLRRHQVRRLQATSQHAWPIF